MSYALIDDNLHSHPDTLAMSDKAFRLYVCGITYCKQQNTRGQISFAAARGLAGQQGASNKAIDELTALGKWEIADECYVVHNWDKWQSDMDKRSEAGRKGAAMRWQKGSHANGNAIASESQKQPEPEPKPKDISLAKASSLGSEILEVFDAWKKSTGHTHAVLDEKRKGTIARALKKYPLADVVDAVQGWPKVPHNAGENERHQVYNGIELLLRDAEHIERFRDAWRGAVPLRPEPPGRKYDLDDTGYHPAGGVTTTAAEVVA